jgi:signal transduction histidine kinase
MAEIAKTIKGEKLSAVDEAALFRQLAPFLRYCLPLNHDLNNPLAGIIGYCEFMQEEADDLTPNQLEYLNHILICAERIQKITERLSEAKIELSDEIDIGELEKILDHYRA